MEFPLVSVIIPTYKRPERLISRSIESVMNQSYVNLEIIIIDDSPNDFEGRKSVERYINSLNDKRVKYIKHAENMGANIARNTGIENSRGEYCAFLDDDDEWAHNKLSLQMEKFLEDEETALVYCKAEIINEVTGERRPIINEIKTGYHYHSLLKQNFIGSNSYVVIRKQVLIDVGKYDDDLLSNQDYDLFLRISKYHKIDGVEEKLVYYYIHPGERITTNAEKQLQGRLALYEKYYSEVKQSQELINIWNIKNIPLYYRVNKKGKAVKQLLFMFSKHPLFVSKYLFNTLLYRLQMKKDVK